MDAKRIVPVLHILEGRVVDPDSRVEEGLPAQRAKRLELEGADEVLLVDLGRDRRARQAWVTEVAKGLFIPFALEAPFEDGAEVAEALEAGADKAVVPAADLQRFQVEALGRSRIVAALTVLGSQEDCSGALEAMVNLGQTGAGEILLTAGPAGLAELCYATAGLATPVLLRIADPGLAVEALAHGADGIVFPAGQRTAAAFKDLLGAAQVPLRY
jgi:hypothetical protein